MLVGDDLREEIEAGGVADVTQRGARDAQIGQDAVGHATNRREAGDGLPHVARNEAEHARVDPGAHLRRVGGFGEDIENLADAPRVRVREMEATPVFSRRVSDVIEGIDHEVHRHDVEAPALDADERHPLRQGVSKLLDELEEIVGPVDLVRFAGV